MPLISVIIPAHNNETTITTAIQSMIDQTHIDLEIIVVDDNSTDATRAVVDSFPSVRSLALPFDDPHRFNRRGVNINAGWMARNFGIDHARGEWITFQDADDVSLLNRIETQYELAQRFSSAHVCIGWQSFNEVLLGQTLDANAFLQDHPEALMPSQTISALAKKTKGFGCTLLGPLHSLVPFPLKRRTRFFFSSWDPYPFAGNSPLVRRDVFDRVRFRPRHKRVWPSDRGRGADRDFNFQVADIFQNSLCANIPLYLWRTDKKSL
ncbi:glycosyltransferase family 2 protein [Candidatus Uhrbacteria bacterium]|nr:glycosyltransferase family 2 protein [Candidatus Uhrbacteria bacterium]